MKTIGLYAVWTSMVDPCLIEAATFGAARAKVGDPKAVVPLGLYTGGTISPDVALVKNPFATYDRGRVGMRFEDRFYPLVATEGSATEAIRYREGTCVQRLGPALVECLDGCGGWAHAVERCDLCMALGPCSRDLIDAPARVVEGEDGEEAEVRHDSVCAACARKLAIVLDVQAAKLRTFVGKTSRTTFYEHAQIAADVLGKVRDTDWSPAVARVGCEVPNQLTAVSMLLDAIEEQVPSLEAKFADLPGALADARKGLDGVLDLARRLRGGR